MIKTELYFNTILEDLTFSDIVETFSLIKKRIIGNELYFRIKISLIDKSILEVSNYLTFNSEIIINRYSYNWFDENLIIRWDNAEHHKELKNFPFHKHSGRNKIIPDKQRSIFEILEYIKKEIKIR